ncbi:ComEC/Rec2 family competence protein [Microbacterium fluvii]|uniref:ComEC/Rec2 family competence protein n=1 Tax=Microbacterium fluvii TaxID=415215 RepID=A0ABW2HEX2_9MICO|nr:ComEC/Rec2 family competence protein [Microbacterium fluvii]MCU4671894.1 ComEC/Rec2 family competence protein [Microbacterium fluvii]
MLRLAPVAACAWLTAGLLVAAPHAAAPAALALWGAALIAVAAALRWPGAVVVVAAFALAAAAATASNLALAQPARERLIELGLDGGRAVEVHALVTGKIEPRGVDELAFDAQATLVVVGAAQTAVAAPVRIVVPRAGVAPGTPLDIGSTVVAAGTTYPGRTGERAVLVVDATRGVEVCAPPGGVLALASTLRHGLVAAVDELPAPGGQLVPGLAVGDTSLVGADLDTAMKTSSLSHLTAVSGANCALVTGLAFAIAAGCGCSRRLRVGVALGALSGFVVLVSLEPSVVRAAAMSAAAMLAVLLGRPAVGAASLCLGIAVLLIADPWLCGSLGFALSVAATAALLLCAGPVAVALARVLPRLLALALAVPLTAQLACGPLLVLIDPTISVYGVPANLLVGAAAPVATVLGLAACIAAPVAVLQLGLAALAWLPAAWISGVATTVSALPGARLAWLPDGAGALLLAGVGAATLGVLLLRHRPRMRAGAAAALALVAGVSAGGALLDGAAGRFTVPAQWAVLACDVGQGDAVLVKSGGAVALIDTGPDPAALHRCLDRVGVGRIDLLVLTHYDLDHVGGVAAVIGRVGFVLHGPAGEPDEVDVVRRLTDAGAAEATAQQGMSGVLGDARWRVLWPRADDAAFPSGNDASVVLDVRGGAIPPSLLLGDLSAAPQQTLAASGVLDPPYALVKVAHHGSADQHPPLYARAAPRVALVTVGLDNDYGHPRAETLALLDELGAAIARTDLEGLVAVWMQDDGVAVWRERAEVGAPD